MRAARVAAEDRDVAEEARADDQAVRIGRREQLDATCAEAFTAMRQRILANNRIALVEACRCKNMMMRLTHCKPE